MAELAWNQAFQRRHESGVDRGVFYPPVGFGVAWSGLVSVEESNVGGDQVGHHYDGVKYFDQTSPTNYQATLTAFSAPYQFGPCVGDREALPGVILTRQARTHFGLSYRTRIGDGEGYKLHIVYNAVATPASKSYETLSEGTTAPTFSWTINATPPRSSKYRPSAHYILDSTKTSPDIIESIEAILYGSWRKDPRLPPVEELVDRISLWDPRIILTNQTGGVCPLERRVAGDVTPTRTPGVYFALPVHRFKPTFIRGVNILE